ECACTHMGDVVARKTDKEHEDQKLKILLFTKYKQEPPAYKIKISSLGKEYLVTCSRDQAYYYEAFQKQFFSLHDIHLPDQRQSTWKKIYAAALKETKEVEAQEGTVGGQ